MKYARLCILISLITQYLLATSLIDVTDMTFVISGRSEKMFYYKFASGDTIIINAAVVKGNNISEITIIEWPSSVKFQAVSMKSVNEKKIFVPKTNMYTFKMKNSATFKKQTYSLAIRRIPQGNETIAFNTTVEWDTLYDTTYVPAVETVLVKIDTIIEDIINTERKLGSQLRTRALGSNLYFLHRINK